MKTKTNTLFLKRFFLCSLFIFYFTGLTNAQISRDTTTIWEFRTKDGNVYQGKIMSRSKENIFLKTKTLGTLAIRRKDIKGRDRLRDGSSDDSGYGIKNRLSNRYMLVPSGMLQARGEGYYENKYVFVNHLNIGVSDGFSLGLGTIPTFLFGGSGTPVWIVPKFRIKTKNKNIHLSVGAAWGNFLFDEYYSDYNYLLPYAMGTYGNENISLTVGLAYGYWEDGWMPSPAFTFSGSVRVDRYSYLFLENIFINTFTKGNYYDDSPKSFNIVGVRRIWRKITLDFGLILPGNIDDRSNDGEIPALPYLALVVPFGKAK